MLQLPEDYAERVYAGWLGKCIGVRFGAPLENWTYQKIKDYLGEVDAYLPIPEGKIFQPDDDTSVPMILIRSVEDYGPGVTSEQIGLTLLNYLGDQHGSLWWGGYGASTEHTAYLNLKNGIPALLSGSAQLNGLTVAEQIGGQIFSDIWGWMVPNNPAKAAEYARKASSVTHDRNGVYGGMFVAAMVSAAFNSQDPKELIRQGLEVIPEDCEYARVVNSVVKFHLENSEDWRACYQYILHNYGYDHYSGIVHIIPNAGLIVMGLLYGEGDFSRSIAITNMGGWDTDCNVGNVAAIVATATGLEGIADRWREPQNDCFVAASIVGTANLLDIPTVADRLVRCGQMIARESGLPKRERCHFRYPGSTHGFLHWGEQRNILVLRQANFDGHHTLRGIVRLLKKKQDMGIYLNTYLEPKQLSSDYYAAGMSPTIYPGQTIKTHLYLPEGSPKSILVGLYVYDNTSKQRFQGGSILIQPALWEKLEWTIPAIPNACLSQAGLIFRTMSSDTWKGEFYLDDFDWEGTPQLDFSFAHWPMQYGSAAQWTYLRGYWRVEEGGYHGSGNEISETYIGEKTWQDLHLQVKLTPHYGETHCVLLRVQGALHGYAAGLSIGKLVIYKKQNGIYREVAALSYHWQFDQQQELNIQVEGNHLHVEVPAANIHLDWQDEDQPCLYGMLGLASFANCHTSFEELHVR